MKFSNTWSPLSRASPAGATRPGLQPNCQFASLDFLFSASRWWDRFRAQSSSPNPRACLRRQLSVWVFQAPLMPTSSMGFTGAYDDQFWYRVYIGHWWQLPVIGFTGAFNDNFQYRVYRHIWWPLSVEGLQAPLTTNSGDKVYMPL